MSAWQTDEINRLLEENRELRNTIVGRSAWQTDEINRLREENRELREENRELRNTIVGMIESAAESGHNNTAVSALQRVCRRESFTAQIAWGLFEIARSGDIQREVGFMQERLILSVASNLNREVDRRVALRLEEIQARYIDAEVDRQVTQRLGANPFGDEESPEPQPDPLITRRVAVK